MQTIKSNLNDKEYVFHVALIEGQAIGSGGRYLKKVIASDKVVWRKIAILGRQSLYKLAEAIIDSFDFYPDHCFGFFSNTENFYNLTNGVENYELFADLEAMGIEPVDSGSVKKTKIQKVWQKIGDKMIFMFDYGDDWRFWVEMEGIKEIEKNRRYPKILGKHGKSPEQY